MCIRCEHIAVSTGCHGRDIWCVRGARRDLDRQGDIADNQGSQENCQSTTRSPCDIASGGTQLKLRAVNRLFPSKRVSRGIEFHSFHFWNQRKFAAARERTEAIAQNRSVRDRDIVEQSFGLPRHLCDRVQSRGITGQSCCAVDKCEERIPARWPNMSWPIHRELYILIKLRRWRWSLHAHWPARRGRSCHQQKNEDRRDEGSEYNHEEYGNPGH